MAAPPGLSSSAPQPCLDASTALGLLPQLRSFGLLPGSLARAGAGVVLDGVLDGVLAAAPARVHDPSCAFVLPGAPACTFADLANCGEESPTASAQTFALPCSALPCSTCAPVCTLEPSLLPLLDHLRLLRDWLRELRFVHAALSEALLAEAMAVDAESPGAAPALSAALSLPALRARTFDPRLMARTRALSLLALHPLLRAGSVPSLPAHLRSPAGVSPACAAELTATCEQALVSLRAAAAQVRASLQAAFPPAALETLGSWYSPPGAREPASWSMAAFWQLTAAPLPLDPETWLATSLHTHVQTALATAQHLDAHGPASTPSRTDEALLRTRAQLRRARSIVAARTRLAGSPRLVLVSLPGPGGSARARSHPAHLPHLLILERSALMWFDCPLPLDDSFALAWVPGSCVPWAREHGIVLSRHHPTPATLPALTEQVTLTLALAGGGDPEALRLAWAAAGDALRPWR